jgi:hypothetical protein
MKSALIGTLIAAGIAVWPMGRSVRNTVPEPAPSHIIESPAPVPAAPSVTLNERALTPSGKLFKDIREEARALSAQARQQASHIDRSRIDTILNTLSALEQRNNQLLDWQEESLQRMMLVASFLSEEVDVSLELRRSAAAETAERKQSLRNIDELASRIVAYIDAYEEFGRSVEKLNQLDEGIHDLEELRLRENRRPPQWASM